VTVGGEVAIEVGAALSDDALSGTARAERQPGNVVPVVGELDHLLIALVGNVAIEELDTHLVVRKVFSEVGERRRQKRVGVVCACV
jgi:hypothetical protein